MGSRLRKFALVICLWPAGCMVAQPLERPTAPPDASPDQIEVFAEIMNAHRRKVGCKPLAWVGPVARVAQQHSLDMVANRFFSHTNLLGETPFDRLRKAGIKYTRAAENIAQGQRSAQHVLNSWLTSPGHRRNIEDCAFQQHGLGLYQNHWTHLFVTLPK
jgi:uncharacterized protein YkwD